MTDVALENARARQAEIERRVMATREEIEDLKDLLDRLQSELAEMKKFVHTWHVLAGIPTPSASEQNGKLLQNESKPKKPKNPDRDLVAEACVEYIRAAGKPLGRAELFDRLHADGIIIQGKDPQMVLSTMLWRSKGKIERLAKGGYWLPGVALTEADNASISELFGDT